MNVLGHEALRALLEQRKQLKNRVSPGEWQARVELAACYRLIAHFRMTDWIYNHISARLPDSHEHYLINPFGLLYDEVSASNLVKVDVHGNLAEDVALDVNPAAFVIHASASCSRPNSITCCTPTARPEASPRTTWACPWTSVTESIGLVARRKHPYEAFHVPAAVRDESPLVAASVSSRWRWEADLRRDGPGGKVSSLVRPSTHTAGHKRPVANDC